MSRRRLTQVVAITTALVIVGSAASFAVAHLDGRPKPAHHEPATLGPPSTPTPTPTIAPRPIAPKPASPSPRQSASAPACRNSYEPSCGPFRWLRPPGRNAPAHVSIKVTPEHPVVGEEVTVVVTASDEDAPHIGFYMGSSWESDVVLGTPLACRRAYGPWTPPHPKAGRGEITYKHTYSKAGTFQVVVFGLSSSGSPWHEGYCYFNDPYGGETGAEVIVQVSEAPTPSPVPTTSPF